MTNWREIEGFPRYEVSDTGLVRSQFRQKRILKPGKTGGRWPSRKYLSVVLCTGDGQKFNKLVHRLVAQAFLSNPNSHPVVNHISGDCLDNRAANLEWCSASQNEQHSYRVLNKMPNSTARRLSDEQIAAIKDDRRIQKETASAYGVSQATVSLIKRGLRKCYST